MTLVLLSLGSSVVDVVTLSFAISVFSDIGTDVGTDGSIVESDMLVLDEFVVSIFQQFSMYKKKKRVKKKSNIWKEENIKNIYKKRLDPITLVFLLDLRLDVNRDPSFYYF